MKNPNEGIKKFLNENYFNIASIAYDIGMTPEELNKKLNGEDELLFKEAIGIKNSIKNSSLEFLFNYKQTENSEDSIDSQNQADLSEEELLIQLIDSRIKQILQSLQLKFKFD